MTFSSGLGVDIIRHGLTVLLTPRSVRCGVKKAKPAKTRSPGDFIRDELVAREWTQADLARVLDRPLPTINRILQGKHGLLPEMAIALGVAFGTGPEVWMEREAAYRLSLADFDDGAVRRRSRLYNLVPVNELQKRLWISQTDDMDKVEDEVKSFLEIPTLDDEPMALGPMRKTDAMAPLSPIQRAWCYRVRHLAKLIKAAPYDTSRIDDCRRGLRKLMGYPQDAAKLPDFLASYGIRFVVVEPLSGSKVDGVALWLDSSSPVIGVSVRYDRIDAFWFTVCHELSHVIHRDEASFDSDADDGQGIAMTVKSPTERRADKESAETLIDPNEMQSFIRRVGPMYSKQSIIQFAHRIKVHPGIIVGQLHHRHEIGFRANREMLIKVRDNVASTALTDGWGQLVETGV
jgi:HTH-type transcriptional regulator/antitoxin HigA